MSDDSLNLGVNDAYSDAIHHASQRTGMPPESIAAVINAEAARGPKGKWKADSYNKKSKAQGLTQFIPSTWLMMAKTPGTELNEQSAGMTNQQILALRTDPQLSITTAAEYDSDTLTKLQDQGLVSKNLTPTQKAQYAYLGHHEGLGGASTILEGTLTDKRARKLLPIQVGKKQANKLIAAAGGDASKAYTDWLNGYIQKKIQPDQFKGTGDPPQLRGTLPADSSTSASSASGGPRIQSGEPSVLLGVDQWMAAHVQSPHQAGGQVAQGSNTVFVGPDKLPFARKGDATTDMRFVWGDTQPDIFIGGVPSSASGTADPAAKPTPWWGSLPDPLGLREMTAYYMNDAKFDLPDAGFVDRTVTYLVGKSPRGVDLVLLVERRPLPEGKSLRQVAAEHGQEAAQRLRGYTVLSEREGEVAWLPAIDVAARWRSDGGAPIYTRRTHLALGPTWLVVTCEAPIAEREACDGYADQVLGSLRLRE